MRTKHSSPECGDNAISTTWKCKWFTYRSERAHSEMNCLHAFEMHNSSNKLYGIEFGLRMSNQMLYDDKTHRHSHRLSYRPVLALWILFIYIFFSPVFRCILMSLMCTFGLINLVKESGPHAISEMHHIFSARKEKKQKKHVRVKFVRLMQPNNALRPWTFNIVAIVHSSFFPEDICFTICWAADYLNAFFRCSEIIHFNVTFYPFYAFFLCSLSFSIIFLVSVHLKQNFDL